MANYRDAEGIEFVYHGNWSDPELIYDGKSFNYWDIEDALWSMFCEELSEDTGKSVENIDLHHEDYEEDFDKFVQNYAVDYLEDCIFGGYFDN